MEQLSSSARNKQKLSEEPSHLSGFPPTSILAVPQSPTSQASFSEVSQAPYVPPQNTDPRRGTAQRGFVWGIVSILAFLVYFASILVTILTPPFLGAFTGLPIIVSLIATLIVSLFGVVFSLRGLKSTTKRGQAMTGLLLSLVPLIILLSLFVLPLLAAW